MHHNHPTLSVGTPFMAAITFLSMGTQSLARSGLTWQTAAALLAGLGSVLIGAAAVSREFRAWWRPDAKTAGALPPWTHWTNS